MNEPVRQEAASSTDLVYETADGYITVAVQTNKQWEGLTRALDRPEWLDDPRFKTPALRAENVDARLQITQDVLIGGKSAEWLDKLTKADVPCAPVLTRNEVIRHPHVAALEIVEQYDHPEAGRLRQARAAARFSATPTAIRSGAPALGEHTDEVLGESAIRPPRSPSCAPRVHWWSMRRESSRSGCININEAAWGGPLWHRSRPSSRMLLLWAIPASAQDKAALPLVAMLRVNSANTIEPMATMFRTALATHGHIDGRNICLESRLAEGRIERLPTLAQSLARDRASVIVTFGEAATRAAQEATKTIPIVAWPMTSVASGLIASMARPGGNITGVSIFATELDAKKLEILHSIVPSARRFAVLHDPATSVLARMEAIHSTAQVLGVTLHIADVRAPADIGPAFVAI